MTEIIMEAIMNAYAYTIFYFFAFRWVIEGVSFIVAVMGMVFIISCFIDKLISNKEIYKAMDESCYYCIFSTNPHSLRDKSRNTCKIINNQDYDSEQIRKCAYRVKE